MLTAQHLPALPLVESRREGGHPCLITLEAAKKILDRVVRVYQNGIIGLTNRPPDQFHRTTGGSFGRYEPVWGV